MAKQTYGILDGYRGSIGPVIGYQWRGRWCLRARPRRVHNPQTEAQQEHRMLFRDMVQMASRMNEVLHMGMRQASLEAQMTEGNLFVKTNKDCFTSQGVDYEHLSVSAGPLAPVAFGAARIDEHNVVSVEFEKNPLQMRALGDDYVYVAAYCPALRQTLLSAPVLRRHKRLSFMLPDEWEGHEMHLYGFVADYQQQASESQYIPLAASGEVHSNTVVENTEYETDSFTDSLDGMYRDGMVPADERLGVAGRREDGDADALGRGAGGAGGDGGQR